MSHGTVAIVGRANVGKSTLFNRIVGERISIVEDTPGVTRDRIYARALWLTREFNIIDTGGIELEDDDFTQSIKIQSEIAIEEADVIIFVVNGREGITSEDEMVARILQKSNKPIVLAVNKIDDKIFADNIYDYYALGVGDPIPVSSAHGIGVGDLLDEVIHLLPKDESPQEHDDIRFCIIGRPNVGKSSLTNALLGEDRVIVSEIEGTTRDAINCSFEKDGTKYTVIDTAGMRKRGKIYENIEKYSVLRALSALENSDVVLVVLDGERGIIEQDKHIAGYAHQSGKGVLFVVNKWDLDYARIAFVSALKKKRIDTLFSLIQEAYSNTRKRIATNVFNDIIVDAQAMNPTSNFQGGRLKIYYGSQVAVTPPTFVLFVNDPKYLRFSYKRYLENKLRDAFGFEGTPIHIICRKRD